MQNNELLTKSSIELQNNSIMKLLDVLER
jgi:hypothetical protein